VTYTILTCISDLHYLLAWIKKRAVVYLGSSNNKTPTKIQTNHERNPHMSACPDFDEVVDAAPSLRAFKGVAALFRVRHIVHVTDLQRACITSKWL